jgi:hypothetical protein
MLIGPIRQPQQSEPRYISIRCPGCRTLGSFEQLITRNGDAIGDVATLVYSKDRTQSVRYVTGHRVCPNPSCASLIFFVWADDDNTLLITYPPERLDFDPIGIPASITAALEEALTCHAHECYIASAIMVRKTLEELCHEQGATGGNLKDRIRSLGAKIILSKELMEGVDDLRLLGNDAAHIESQEFNKIGREEVEIGIQFTKEVLKATFQHSNLLARIRSLKRIP